jgi:hypothetical protein
MMASINMKFDKIFAVPYSRVGVAGAGSAGPVTPDPYLNFYPDPLELLR